jgi:hypothetical protein
MDGLYYGVWCMVYAAGAWCSYLVAAIIVVLVRAAWCCCYYDSCYHDVYHEFVIIMAAW